MRIDFRIDKLFEKAGGKFKLTVLVQKRLQEIIRNGDPIGSVGSSRAYEKVVGEIETNAIALIPEGTPSNPPGLPS